MNNKKLTITPDISFIGKDILCSLIYYNIFKYPLSFNEILNNSNVKGISEQALLVELDILKEKGIIFFHEGFYLLDQEYSKVAKRKNRNQRAQNIMPIAKKMSGLIGRFPFVRGVFISGSLSKNSMDEDSDVDFFIIGVPNRLWICRALLKIYKKLFLAGSHKYFCYNYFVDTTHLEIAQQNIFTATEVVTLIPMVGEKYYQSFKDKNQWVKEFYPNYPAKKIEEELKVESFLKKTIELIIDNKLGNKLDQWCMRKFSEYWNKKYNNFTKEELNAAITVEAHSSRNHPRQFQRKILKWYEDQIKLFEEKLNTNLKS